MIAFLTLVYCLILLVLVKLKILPWNLWTKISPLLVSLLLMILLFLPMQFFAPSGDAIVLRYSVQIVPNVAGEVTEVPVKPYVPIRKGDILFRIEPRPYQAAVDALQAQLTLAERRVEQSRALAEQKAGSLYELELYESQVEGLRAQLMNAQFNLEQTEVHAPADGHVTNLALRPGARVMSASLAPAMAFVDTSEHTIACSVHQIWLRHVEPGQEAEVTFKVFPGQVFEAKVEWVISDLATGQVTPGGTLPTPGQIAPVPFFVRLKLVDEELARSLPTGAVGTVAIYTGGFEISYAIRRVMMRMEAWMNYIFPA